jgi:hypothetical protein
MSYCRLQQQQRKKRAQVCALADLWPWTKLVSSHSSPRGEKKKFFFFGGKCRIELFADFFKSIFLLLHLS